MRHHPEDLFRTPDGAPRVVAGVAVYSAAPRLAELAARIGFDTVWIEIEHGPSGFEEAEHICMALEAAGAVGAIRVPDAQRCHILRALETGASIVIVPMVDDAETARRIVEFGRFPPLGKRGFNARSRGVGYGLTPVSEAFAAANRRTHLIAQIETVEGVADLDAICAVEGLSGILIGPGDLSMSLGCGGDLASRRLIETACDCIRRARAAGRHAGILVGPGPLLDAALAAGCDLVFAGGDVTNLIEPWQNLLADLRRRESRS